MAPAPNFSAIADPITQTRESAGAGDRAPPRTTKYGHPLHMHALTPLPEPTTLSARTCKNIMFPDTASTKLSPKVPPLTNIRHLNNTPHTRKPRSEMRPRDTRRPCALPQFLVDRQWIYPPAISPA